MEQVIFIKKYTIMQDLENCGIWGIDYVAIYNEFYSLGGNLI